MSNYLPVSVRLMLACELDSRQGGRVVYRFDSPELLIRLAATPPVLMLAEFGCLRTLQRSEFRGITTGPQLMLVAAHAGSLELVEALHNELRGSTQLWTSPVMGSSSYVTGAAGRGHFDTVHYLIGQGYSFDWQTTIAAAEGGYLKIIVYLHGLKGDRIWSERAYSAAVESGCLEVVRYVHEHGCPRPHNIIRSAIMGDNIEILDYLHFTGAPWYDGACTKAARYGHLNALRYLHQRGYPWDQTTMREAVHQFELLRYLHGAGCPWDATVFEAAARTRHIETIKYLYKHNCPWSIEVGLSATRAGALEILQYLCRPDVEQPRGSYSWSHRFCQEARKTGRQIILDYGQEVGCSECDGTPACNYYRPG